MNVFGMGKEILESNKEKLKVIRRKILSLQNPHKLSSKNNHFETNIDKRIPANQTKERRTLLNLLIEHDNVQMHSKLHASNKISFKESSLHSIMMEEPTQREISLKATDCGNKSDIRKNLEKYRISKMTSNMIREKLAIAETEKYYPSRMRHLKFNSTRSLGLKPKPLQPKDQQEAILRRSSRGGGLQGNTVYQMLRDNCIRTLEDEGYISHSSRHNNKLMTMAETELSDNQRSSINKYRVSNKALTTLKNTKGWYKTTSTEGLNQNDSKSVDSITKNSPINIKEGAISPFKSRKMSPIIYSKQNSMKKLASQRKMSPPKMLEKERMQEERKFFINLHAEEEEEGILNTKDLLADEPKKMTHLMDPILIPHFKMMDPDMCSRLVNWGVFEKDGGIRKLSVQERNKIVIKGIRTYLQKLKKLKLTLHEVTHNEVFSKKPFDKPGLKMFLNLIKEDKFDLCKELLLSNRYILYGYDNAGTIQITKE